MTESITKNLEAISPTHVRWGNKIFAASFGKNGFTADKEEGDHATPYGSFPMRYVYYRPDKVTKPETIGLPVIALHSDDGWCDAPEDPQYNRPVKKPYAASHEDLWRQDDVYDIIVVLGQNDDPPVPGKGSAIFLHLRNPEGTGTEGCVALSEKDLREVLRESSTHTHVIVPVGIF